MHANDIYSRIFISGVIVTQQPGATVHYIQTSHGQPVAASQPQPMYYNAQGQPVYMQGQQPMVMYSQPMPMTTNVHPQPMATSAQGALPGVQGAMSGQPMASGVQATMPGQPMEGGAHAVPPAYSYHPGAQTNVSYSADPAFHGQHQEKVDMPPAYSA